MHDPKLHPDADADADAPASGGAETADATPLLDELLADSTNADDAAVLSAGPRTRVGRLVEWASGQAPKVEFPGNERGPLAARSIVPLDPTTITEAIQTARGVLLTFEDGRPDAPIITGLLQDFGDLVGDLGKAAQVSSDTDQGPSESDPALRLTEVEARVDGKRIEFEAADEIVLRCGQASIVLRRNGRVVIRGTYVESRSRGVNRIKGGSVQIN